MENLPFKWDIERMIDDFVFMCFFVGNDFLPHLPSLEIREGAIEQLLALHKRLLPSLGGYLTENGVVNLSRVAVLLSELGVVEDKIFKSRRQREDKFKEREERHKQYQSRKEREEKRINDNRKEVEFHKNQVLCLFSFCLFCCVCVLFA
jgi:5'-3' exoribonuclease 2